MIITEHSTLLEIANDVTATAVEHGWWESDRSDIEQVMLITSEVFEAFEAYRKAPEDTMMLEISKELVDVVIRILDHIGHGQIASVELHEYDLTTSIGSIHEGVKRVVDENPTILPTGGPEEFMAALVSALFVSYSIEDYTCTLNMEACIGVVGAIIWMVYEVAQQDFVALLQSKMDENRNRPYRHGGRRA